MEHYRIYMKTYGVLIMQLADSDKEVQKIIDGEDLGQLLVALRQRIEDSPYF